MIYLFHAKVQTLRQSCPERRAYVTLCAFAMATLQRKLASPSAGGHFIEQGNKHKENESSPESSIKRTYQTPNWSFCYLGVAGVTGVAVRYRSLLFLPTPRSVLLVCWFGCILALFIMWMDFSVEVIIISSE